MLIGSFDDFKTEYPSYKITYTVSYESIFGTSYEDTATLDTSYAESISQLMPKRIEDIVDPIGRIAKTLDQLLNKKSQCVP